MDRGQRRIGAICLLTLAVRASLPGSRETPSSRVAGASVLLGCQPRLPDPPGPVAPHAAAELSVLIEPDAALSAAPRVLRFHVTTHAAERLDPEAFSLVRGHLSAAQLRQLAAGAPPASLAERVVPLSRWTDAASGAAILAPLVALEPGQPYALAGTDVSLVVALTALAHDSVPLLPRLWPPAGEAATRAFGVWCGEEVIPVGEEAVALEPGGPIGRMLRGVTDDLGTRCVRFEASSDAGAPPSDVVAALVPPPSIRLGGAQMRLEPRPFALEVQAKSIGALACAPSEEALGLGCATVKDDRVAVRTPEAPLFWAIVGGGLDEVRISRGETLVLAHVLPAAPIELRLAVVDAAGQVSRGSFSATTLPAAPHVVLSEVLADPLGSEPQEEWVELFNDGPADAQLSGYVLLDPGGTTPLPDAVLAPGGYALLVNDDFILDDGFDPPPIAGTLLLRVPKLGHAGLSNQGEPLALEDANGVVVSKFAAVPKPKPGVSVVRVDPLAPDELPGSFAISAHRASPGGPNDP